MLKVEDYVGRRRDSREELVLAKELRALPPYERFTFIVQYIEHDPIVGLELGRRSLQEAKWFEALLGSGFLIADASSIRFWLKVCVPRLGARRVLAMLTDLAKTSPAAFHTVVYWSTIYILEADAGLRAELNALRVQSAPRQ